MKVQAHAAVAIVALLLMGSGAAAQTVDAGYPTSVPGARRLLLPADSLQNSPELFGIVTNHRVRAQPPLAHRAAIDAQIKRGSKAGKAANLVLAGFIGGMAGFYVGGFAGESIRCGCSPEYFDATVGAPIGAIVGGARAATYVHRRHRP